MSEDIKEDVSYGPHDHHLAPSGPPQATQSLLHRPRPALAPKGLDLQVKSGNDTYTVDDVKLSDEQIKAVNTLMSSDKRTRILTGRAGAGKSLVIKYLRQRYGLKVCATTGKAAVAIGGTTVHSLFAMRTVDEGPYRCFNSGYRDFCMQKSTGTIVLDEASMCGERMSVYLADCLEKYDKNLILVGDWAQASPVKDDWPFNTSFWRDAERVKLLESHRQNDPAFVNALDEARLGQMSPETRSLFLSCVDPFPVDEPGVVRMYATNDLTSRWNAQKLQEHLRTTGYKPFQVDSLFIDNRDPGKQASDQRNGAFQDTAIEDSRLAHQCLLAVGAQVLITKNARGEFNESTEEVHKAYVNGDTGIIEEVRDHIGVPLDPEKTWAPVNIGSIMVRRTRDNHLLRIGKATHETVNALDVVIHSVSGFPLALGWALTIHKSQGMSVDKTWLDMKSILCFPPEGRHGIGYVGLSRTRTLQGLKLSEFLPRAVVCDDIVKPWI